MAKAKKTRKPAFHSEPVNVGKDWSEMVMGDFPASVLWEKPSDEITGVVSDLKEGVGEDGDQRVIILDTPEGKRTLWEAKGLSTLFDNFNSIKGNEARIIFDKTVKVKGRKQPMRIFRVYVRKPSKPVK